MYTVRMKEMRKGRTIKNRVLFTSEDRAAAVARMKPEFDAAIKAWDEKYMLETGYGAQGYWAIPINHDRCIKVFLVES